MLTLIWVALLALPFAATSAGNCQEANSLTQMGSDILQENVLPGFSASAQDEPKGCCCIMKDSGPPPTWSCQGVTPSTMETKRQCAEDADAASTKYKWHEGPCTDND